MDIQNLAKQVEDLRASVEAELEKLRELTTAQGETLERFTVLLEGRNKSAPLIRNMTDADALAVLTGPYKELPHKEAAAAAGVSYSQVYSCRLEFTFKHVHKGLRDGGWKNPWERAPGVRRIR